MNWKRDLALFVSTAVLLIGVAGCASVKKEVDIVWPLPPDEPKIKYVEGLRSEKDLQKEGGIGDAIFGADASGSLTRPYSCATDAEGRIYTTDIGRVFVFDQKNKKLSFIGDEASTGKLAVPLGIAVSRDGKVYVADSTRKKVLAYDSKWNLLTAFGKAGELDGPSGVAIDEKRGRLYVTDAKKHKILVYVLADGTLLKTIGGRGEEPGKFNYPTNIILDSEDNLYVVDTAFNNIQVFNKKGDLLIFVGEGGFAPGRFNSPSGICIDDEDRIIVADGMNGRLQVLQYMGEKWKKKHPDEVKWKAPKTETVKTDAPKTETVKTDTPKTETSKPTEKK